MATAIGLLARMAYLESQMAPAGEARLYIFVVPLLDLLGVGGVMVFGDLSRDKSGRTESALFCLPLTKRDVSILTWLPTALFVGLGLAAVATPSVSALVGLGQSFGQAGAVVASACACGVMVIAVPKLVAAVVWRGDQWNSVRLPLVVVLWLVLVVGEIWASVSMVLDGGSSWLALMVVPILVQDLFNAVVVVPHVLFFIILGLVSVALMVAAETAQIYGLNARAIRCPWPAAGRAPLIRGEFRYTLRQPMVTASAMVALIFSLGAAVGMVQAPPQAQFLLSPCALALFVVLGCVAAQSMRGLFDSVAPSQRLIGLRPGPWALRQNVIALVLSAGAYLPPFILVAASTGSIWLTARYLGLLLSCVAITNLIAHVVVVRSGNPGGQIVQSLVLLSVL
ncbi:MAG: hypothetical protein LBK42_04730, partial [Propionibacteriaceae bacterium]|nr:hypothetical protein [Propionibacteriaceae bacterium]